MLGLDKSFQVPAQIRLLFEKSFIAETEIIVSNFTQQLVDRARRRSIADIPTLQAARRPNKPALIFEGWQDTFAEFDDFINRTANALISLGLRKGDRVALLSHNNRSFALLRWAIVRIGGVAVPINFMLNANEVGYILKHARVKAIFAEDALCKVVDDALSGLDHSCAIKGFIRHDGHSVGPPWLDTDELINYHDRTAVDCPNGEDDPVQLMFTSGTESRPKGALISSRALIAQYTSCIIDGGMSSEDVELHCLPLYHCAQLDCFLSVDHFVGATSVLLRAPDPAEILKAVEAHRISKLFCPPTVWISLLRHPDFAQRDLSSLTKGYYGASIMPRAIVIELLNVLPGLKLWNFYGQTELSPLATVLQPEDQLRKLGSAGRPGIHVMTKIVDDEGLERPVGQVGEIVHRSPQLTLGYVDDDTNTAKAFAGAWFHSGDLGYFDADGYLYIVDRKKDMVKTGGENVASREVEEALMQHPDVLEVAVFGLPDERWIEAVTAAVVPRAGINLTVESLRIHAKSALAPYKRPKRFIILEGLPKNASGKVLKRELREIYSGSL